MFNLIIGMFIGGCWIGAHLVFIWCFMCYIPAHLRRDIERLFEWLISIDSKVKRLSERLKTNDTDSIKAEAKLKKLKTN